MKIIIITSEFDVNYSIQANKKELKVLSDNIYYLEHFVEALDKELCHPPVPTAADPLAPLANENL